MRLRPSRRAALVAMAVGFALHTVTALWTWRTWGVFGRGNVVAWMDFPISLAYLHLDGEAMLVWSLLAGGLQWAVIAALLTLLLGQSVRRRAG
jgi:hypothetical protein